ncbi:MAG: Holliday junction resolvase RuvX, partial [Candidatus Saccharibacteria bacterium]|nr:Holliday junction resolvase RuvX [Candidatus Saccharibacteria bacterium]
VAKLEKVIIVPTHLQDEALTSVKAEEELKSRGMPFEKGDIDALAATYILQDFLDELPEESHAV